jgi:hypothetical protein
LTNIIVCGIFVSYGKRCHKTGKDVTYGVIVMAGAFFKGMDVWTGIVAFHR